MNVGAVEVNNAISEAMAMEMPKQDLAVRQTRPIEEEGEAASQEQVKQLVDEMQSQINRMEISLEYSTYGEQDEKIAIVLVNKQTGEVIREIPAEEIQNLYAKMSELTGMIFNRQV